MEESQKLWTQLTTIDSHPILSPFASLFTFTAPTTYAWLRAYAIADLLRAVALTDAWEGMEAVAATADFVDMTDQMRWELKIERAKRLISSMGTCLYNSTHYAGNSALAEAEAPAVKELSEILGRWPEVTRIRLEREAKAARQAWEEAEERKRGNYRSIGWLAE